MGYRGQVYVARALLVAEEQRNTFHESNETVEKC